MVAGGGHSLIIIGKLPRSSGKLSFCSVRRNVAYMGMTSLLISARSHCRIARAHAWLEARAPAEEVLIIGASLDAANELARKVVQARGAAFGWHRLTLPQLAALLAASAPIERRVLPLGHLGVQAICARVVHRLAARGELGRYSSIAEGPGFARALARVVMELRLAKLGPDDLRIVAPDLSPLVEAYASQLAEDEVTDWAGVLTLATDAMMSEGFTHRLINLPTLLLDVSVASEAELAFVRALSSRIPELVLTSPAGDEATLARLRDGLGLRVEDLDQLPHPDASSGTDSRRVASATSAPPL